MPPDKWRYFNDRVSILKDSAPPEHFMAKNAKPAPASVGGGRKSSLILNADIENGFWPEFFNSLSHKRTSNHDSEKFETTLMWVRSPVKTSSPLFFQMVEIHPSGPKICGPRGGSLVIFGTKWTWKWPTSTSPIAKT